MLRCRVRLATTAVLAALVMAMPALPTASSRQSGAAATPDDAYTAAGLAAAKLPRLRSLLVSVDGAITFERYFGGARATTPANIKSASKSVISALVGIAIDQKLIPSVREPIGTYFPEVAKDADPRKRAITIEDLLTMRSGLQSTSGRGYGAWVLSGNWVRYALTRPIVADPGSDVEYSTGNSHLLSALLTRATGKSTWQFAQEQLARPLGFSLAKWPQDPQGIYFGGNDMLLTPRQMVAFGELYRRGGLAGDTRVLPSSWIAATRVPRGKSPWGSDREYGYGWWIRDFAGEPSYYAWGYGGQFVFVVPSLDMVVVTTSRADASRERRDHLNGIYDIVDGLVAAQRDARAR